MNCSECTLVECRSHTAGVTEALLLLLVITGHPQWWSSLAWHRHCSLFKYFLYNSCKQILICRKKSAELIDGSGLILFRWVWKSLFYMLTFGLLVSNMPVERPIKRALWCLERRGETEREREVSEEDESSTEDWAERMARAAVRRWAGEHNFMNRGSSVHGNERLGQI